jgi:hypothetical protein
LGTEALRLRQWFLFRLRLRHDPFADLYSHAVLDHFWDGLVPVVILKNLGGCMKKRTLIACLLLGLLLSSCVLPVRLTEVRGSGQTETETRRVSGFNSVVLSGVGTLVIDQGAEESLQITTDKNLLEYIESNVSGRALHLGVKEFVNIHPTQDVVYHLTVTDLTNVETSGIGSIEIQKLTSDSLQIQISGAGNVTIYDLEVGHLLLDISGMGNATISGNATDQNVEISGAGNYQAGDLYSQDVDIKISGTGNAKVWAANELALDLSGMGNVDYYGSPTLNMDISGMGKVNSLGDK